MKDGEILLLPADGAGAAAAAAALFRIPSPIIRRERERKMYTNNLDVLSRHKSSIY